MQIILEVNEWLNNIVWGAPMLVLIVGTGVYLSLRLGFLQVRYFGYVIKNTLFKIFSKPESSQGDITPFEALATAIAATVGTGNIAGVATAIATGGPGAIFWMWVSALFGMATKFAEIALAVKYRFRGSDGAWTGGPMYYIEHGLRNKLLAGAFALFGVTASFGIGNMVQANSVADALLVTFGIPVWLTGIVLAVFTGAVIIGGIKRVATFTAGLVPLMAIFYVLGATVIVVLNYELIPAAFASMFTLAFTPAAAAGGFLGATVRQAIRFGIARGVFSNEAGLGSAPIAHAAAQTDHPVRQALWGVFEVFIDTFAICTLTALAILTTGVWKSGVSGAALTTMAFEQGLPGPGGVIVAIGLTLFAFSTTVAWAYYGERCLEYLVGEGSGKFYRAFYLPFIVVGAIGGLRAVWAISDTLNGLMAIPNLIALIGLSGVVVTLVRDFFKYKAP